MVPETGRVRLASCLLHERRLCALHGGKSSGPRTPEGIERIRKARTKHGRYSAKAKAERRAYRQLVKEARELLSAIAEMERCVR